MLQYQWGVLVLKARLKENMMKATSTGSVEEEILDVTEFQKPAMDLLNAYISACSDPDFLDPSSSSKNNNGGGGAGPARALRNSPCWARKWAKLSASPACRPEHFRTP